MLGYRDTPEATFTVKRKIKEITVIITSTGRGQWRSGPHPIPPKPFNRWDPGPWRGVDVSVTTGVRKIAVRVDKYRATSKDYVSGFELADGAGHVVGRSTFAYGKEVKGSFLLKPDTRHVTVTVTSTGRGKWRCQTVSIPTAPADE